MNSFKKWLDYIVLAALFSLILFVYSVTLCPTVYWEDAGELITVSHVLGIAHPPGHPLYTILGHLFALIPHGSIAWRVNLMSAVFGALAACLVYPVTLHLLKPLSERDALCRCAAAAASLFAAFGLILWDQAVVAETSTLHAFFFMALIFLFLEMVRLRDRPHFIRLLFLFSFVYGLSLTNHVAGVFFFPAFLFWALLTLRKQIFTPSRIILSTLFFCLGLSVYLYLPLRSLQDPIIDWGNPETLSNFWWMVSAKQFEHDVLSRPSTSQTLHGLVRLFSNIHADFSGIGIVFLLAGIWTCTRKQRDFLLFCAAVTAVLGAVLLNPAFIPAYFIPALLVMAILLGLGAHTLGQTLIKAASSIKLPHLALSMSLALLLTPLVPLIRHYPVNDRSEYCYAREYGERILRALPQNSAFFTVDVNAIFILWYLQFCENERRDVLVIEPTWLTNASSMSAQILKLYPGLILPAIGEKVREGRPPQVSTLFDKDLVHTILEKNAKVRPVYWGAVPAFDSLRPCGLIYEYLAGDVEVLDERSIRENRMYWEQVADEFQRKPALMSDRVPSLVYPESLRHQAIYYRNKGRDDLALWAFELATRINPRFAPAWLGLAQSHSRAGKLPEAMAAIDRASMADYRARPQARFMRGEIFYYANRFPEAAAEFAGVVKENPDFAGAHNMLGSCFLKLEQLDKAKEQFEEEIARNPLTPDAYSNLAQILIYNGALDEAEKLLVTGTEVQPQAWQNFYFLARLHAIRGEKAKAAELVSRALDIGGAAAAQNLARQDKVLENLLQPEGEAHERLAQ